MKIGIIGCGFVGSSAAYAITLGGVVNEIVLIDRNDNLARSQAEDILHATPFAALTRIMAGDYVASANCPLSGRGVVTRHLPHLESEDKSSGACAIV